MKIEVSKYAGFCFGVKSAVNLIYKAIAENGDSGKRINTLGMLIHNETVVGELSQKGVRVIGEDDIDSLDPEKDVVFLRSHGVSKEIVEKLEKKHVGYIDATCPYVKKNHDTIKKSVAGGAENVIIIGDRDHPEVRGMVSYCGGVKATVCSSPDEVVETFDENYREKPTIILAQTTESKDNYKKCLAIAKKLYTKLTIFDTICEVTGKRQSDCKDLAERSDFMIVIGGENSSNTQKLLEIASARCPSCRISTAAEIPYEKILPHMNVGITAGASTPDRIIKEVANNMSEIITDDKMSFEEMLDQSFKTLRTGEEVEGVVTSILPNEIHLDLGVKHTGILAMDEITSDTSVNLHDMFKIGDKVKVLLQQFSETDGIVKVSKRKIDERLSRQKLMDGVESGEVFTGKVKSAVNGGLIVMCEGQQVFIPLHLAMIPSSVDPQTLVGTEIKFKIIAADKERRKLLGSVRAVVRAEKQAIADKVWSEIEVGKVYEGTVRSIMAYGVFVDIGGVDGMVHIGDLSWGRIRNLKDAFKPGDKLRVFVKSFNPETKKITLSCKFDDENPWTIFEAGYAVGDVVEVTVMNIEPYGAFCEIIPGVDGLVHVSRVSTKRVATPAEVLKIGDKVRAEIVDINPESRKVALSIRAVEEKEAVEAAEAKTEEAPAEAEEAPAEETKTEE